MRVLADERLTVPTDKGANAGAKISALVAGMVAGADSGTFRRRSGRSCGHSRLDTCASSTRSPRGWSPTWPLTRRCCPLLTRSPISTSRTRSARPTATPSRGAGYGYSGVKGLNALLAALSTLGSAGGAPVIVATRLRKGSPNCARGAARLVADAIKTSRAWGRGRRPAGC